MKLSTVAFGLVLIPFTLLADSFTSATTKISTSELSKKVVAAVGDSGLMAGKLMDIEGDCAFAIVHNRQKQTVELQLISGKTDLIASFPEGTKLNYTRTAYSVEALKDNSYTEVFQSEDGKYEARINLTKSAAMSSTVSTPYTKLSCGNL